MHAGRFWWRGRRWLFFAPTGQDREYRVAGWTSCLGWPRPLLCLKGCAAHAYTGHGQGFCARSQRELRCARMDCNWLWHRGSERAYRRKDAHETKWNRGRCSSGRAVLLHWPSIRHRPDHGRRWRLGTQLGGFQHCRTLLNSGAPGTPSSAAAEGPGIGFTPDTPTLEMP